MKDETKNGNVQIINYRNENVNSKNICNENDYKNINKNNILYNHKRCISDNSFDDTFSTTCSIVEQNKQSLCFGKAQYNNGLNYDLNNKVNCNQLNEDNISMDDLKINVKNVKEYSDEIFKNLLEEENKININPNYFDYQNDITPYMRSILIDWLIHINLMFRFKEETLYIAIIIIDSYLSKKFIDKRNFQLLGITSLFISSKLNEILLRSISDYSHVTNRTYDVYEIKNMEIEILKTLNFDLLFPSPLSFYELITQKVGISNDVNKYKFGEFLMQNFMINNYYLNYSSSTIATATCYIIMKFFKIKNYKTIFDNNFFNIKKNNIFNNNINNLSNEYIIKDCAKKICETVNEIINSNLKSTINKYSDNEFYNEIKNIYSSGTSC